MVTKQAISALAKRIVEEYRPERVILFGSYAYGKPRPDSDVDLLVIMPFEGNPLHVAAEMARRLNPPIGVDFLVRAADTIQQRIEWNDYFLREVIEQGKVLYDAADR